MDEKKIDNEEEFLKKRKKMLFERKIRTGLTISFVIVPIVFLAIFFHCIIQIKHVPTESMEPSIHSGSMIMIDAITYNYTEPEIGDVITFQYKGKELVKRVVALPGDDVQIHDGIVLVNGEELSEPYLANNITEGDITVHVKEGNVFCLGDNRMNSADSRVIGSIPMKNITGQVFFSFGFKGIQFL